MIQSIFFLAQESQPTSAPGGALGGSIFTQLVPIVLMVGVFYWIMMRGPRKQKKQQENMLKSMKRNDRVQTIGGIIGTIVDVREDEVVLKVDETNNVKMRFTRGAVKEVLHDTPPAESTK